MAPIKRKRSPKVADTVMATSSASPTIKTPSSDAVQESSPTPESPDARSLRQTTLNFKRSPRRSGPAANVPRHVVEGQKKLNATLSVSQDEPAPPPRKRGRPRKYPLPPEEVKRREDEARRKAEEEELRRKQEAEEQEALDQDEDEGDEESYEDDDEEDHIIEVDPEEDEVVLVGQPVGASDDEDVQSAPAHTHSPARPSADSPLPIPETTPSTAAANNTPTLRTDRNIESVVFGNLMFRTWYQSPYCREVLGLPPGGNKKRKTPLLDCLYVCPMCFKYANDKKLWWKHVRFCCGVQSKDGSVVGKHGDVPGRKVYTHPRTEGEVEGEWSVWEVDGERDSLFCQNLSLFGKLFLDTKSVFFDVTTSTSSS